MKRVIPAGSQKLPRTRKSSIDISKRSLNLVVSKFNEVSLQQTSITFIIYLLIYFEGEDLLSILPEHGSN